DPMQSDDCNCNDLQPIYDRIHLESMGSPGFYRETGEKYGLKERKFENYTDQMITHYGRILEETANMEDELLKSVSPEYINNMKTGLQNWVNGGKSGNLVWGIFVLKKENNV
ncbi:MAG: SAM-dependent methyltransferase, partial [Desulfonatronovibrionaceae bacterium]